MKLVTLKSVIEEYFSDPVNIPEWKIVDSLDDPEFQDADAFFQINVPKITKSNHKMRDYFEFFLSQKKPILVCESSPFRKNLTHVDRNSAIMFRLGWDHYLRQGKFNNKNSPSDRWEKIKEQQNIKIKDWTLKKDGYILLCLQKPNDSSLNSLYENYENYNKWIEDTVKLIRQYTDKPIKIRPHLKAKSINFKHLLNDTITQSTVWKNRNIYEGGKSLEEDLKDAYCVVAYNSNVLVESVCNGIPSIALSDESIAWDVTNRIENIEQLNLNIDRTQWLYDISYMVWSQDEILNGKAWNHLKGVYFNEY